MFISLDSLLSTLKPRQLSAIKHTRAPQLILAGAGTGKTTTITSKIAYMVEKEGVDPPILALTLSREAARNMRELQGNWSPYIPQNLILRHTQPEKLVLDPIMGSDRIVIYIIISHIV